MKINCKGRSLLFIMVNWFSISTIYIDEENYDNILH